MILDPVPRSTPTRHRPVTLSSGGAEHGHRGEGLSWMWREVESINNTIQLTFQALRRYTTHPIYLLYTYILVSKWSFLRVGDECWTIWCVPFFRRRVQQAYYIDIGTFLQNNLWTFGEMEEICKHFAIIIKISNIIFEYRIFLYLYIRLMIRKSIYSILKNRTTRMERSTSHKRKIINIINTYDLYNYFYNIT